MAVGADDHPLARLAGHADVRVALLHRDLEGGICPSRQELDEPVADRQALAGREERCDVRFGGQLLFRRKMLDLVEVPLAAGPIPQMVIVVTRHESDEG